MQESQTPATHLSEAERSILGSMLLNPEAVVAAEELINPGDFYEPKHELIYQAIMGLRQAGISPDVITVGEALMKTGDLQKLGPAYLHNLVEYTPNFSSFEYYADIMARAATRRRLKIVGAKILAAVESGEGDEYELVEAARKAIDSTRATDSGMRLERVGDVIRDMFATMDDPVNQVPTPWVQVNDMMGGMRPGQFIVIAARPSVGKSVMGVLLAMRLSITGAVAFHSLEMSKGELAARISSASAKIDLSRIITKRLTDQDMAKAAQYQPGWDRANLYIDDRSTVTITDIRRHVRSVARTGVPLAGVVVDYLQLMGQASGDRRSRQEFVSDMSRQLKILAKEMQVPVIALSQLNRNSTSREDSMPKISEMRESGSIEQDADVVILMHRELMGDLKNNLSVQVAKNRNGPTGPADLTFVGHNSTIRDPAGDV